MYAINVQKLKKSSTPKATLVVIVKFLFHTFSHIMQSGYIRTEMPVAVATIPRCIVQC